MSKAYRCDKCKTIHDGAAEMQLNFDSAPIGRAVLCVKYNTEIDTAPTHPHDLCPACLASFVEWWTGKKPAYLRSLKSGKS